MPTILKPGILVILSTSVTGGVTYQRKELEAEHTTDSGTTKARWETLREIKDPDEHARAEATRSKARGLVEKLCTPIKGLGMICPTSKIDELNVAVEEAKTLCKLHNASAQSTRVELFAPQFKIAESEAEFAGAVASEVNGLLAQLKNGIGSRSVAEIRAAATRVAEIAPALRDEDAASIQASIDAARKVARQLTRAEKPDGKPLDEKDAMVAEKLVELTLGRFAALDLDAPAPESGMVKATGTDGRFEGLEV